MPSSITEADNRNVMRQGSLAPVNALSRVRGEAPLVLTANGNSGAVSWSDGGAGGDFNLSGTDNVNATYTPPNETRIITITATDGSSPATFPLTVFATMPINPQVGVELELDVETKEKFARDRTRYAREEGHPWINWVFAWEKRQDNDWRELLEFWYYHRKVQQFWMVDIEANLMNRVWFNSSFKSIFNGAQRWAMAASFKGQFENLNADGVGDVAPPDTPTGLTATPIDEESILVEWDEVVE